MNKKKKKIFAIYLPQFHPCPENNIFWHKGFTEWHNVSAARPQFKGHHQPHIPADLGFYDLRLAETMHEQCKLADKYHIDGFIFYHYWFNGRPVLYKPLENYLRLTDKREYFFCWANENWTRRWDGGDNEILLEQKYNRADCVDHIKWLLKFFRDKKYLKINNRPVLAIYKPELGINNMLSFMKEAAIENGFDGIYFIHVFSVTTDLNTRDIFGYDAGLMFEPAGQNLNKGIIPVSMFDKAGKLLHILKLKKQLPLKYRYTLIDYQKYITWVMSEGPRFNFLVYPCVCPGWDNSPRRKAGGGIIFLKSDPHAFKIWLDHVFKNFEPYSDEENFIVINAWNEWAEGNHLEPDLKFGTEYLEAVKIIVEKHDPCILLKIS